VDPNAPPPIAEDAPAAAPNGATAGRAGDPVFPPGPVVQSGPVMARPARSGGAGRRGAPPPYPAGLDVPSVRYQTDGYGLYPNIVKPPFSTLTSYDLNAGTIRWQIPLGDDPRLLRDGITGTGQSNTPRVGIIPTATGLVFSNDGNSRVHAYDAATGKQLWEFAFGAPTTGSGAMYEWKGRQYLLMAASGGSNNTGDAPKGYVAFAIKK
jgi:quinoprotein glucose dehydrogenase